MPRFFPSASSPGSSWRCTGEPWISSLAPRSAASPHSACITPTERARTVRSLVVIESPAGATIKKCNPVMAMPSSAAIFFSSARRAAVIFGGSSESVTGAISSPS